jgi:CheY-like chemotaxis protein
MKILSVDDDWMILELLELAMSVSGQHELTTVTSGEKAIQLLEQGEQRFDCFLLDIQMPHIYGVELCRVIREMPMYKRTPILMATAMSQKVYIDRALAAGASDYVTKPFDFEEL